MTPAETQPIISALESAFADVRCGAVTLHEAEVIDDYGTAEQRARARAHDPEDDWRDVPDRSFEACANAFPHLDPVSWRFYLPAAIRYALRTVHEPRRFSIDQVIYALAFGDDRSLHVYHRARFTTLNAAQAQVVRRFLRLAAQHDACCDAVVAQEALDGYWDRAGAPSRPS